MPLLQRFGGRALPGARYRSGRHAGPASPHPAHSEGADTTRRNPRRRLARRARLRRIGAALLVGLAALLTLSAVTRERALPQGGVVGVPTVVFTRLMAAGSTVGPDDVAVVDLPESLRPEHAFASVTPLVGQVVAGVVEPSEVATRSRLVAADLLVGQPADRVAMTVPVTGAAGTGVQAGSRVDLYSTATGEQPASDVVVLAVSGAGQASGPVATDTTWGQAAPPRLTLALDPPAASRLARHLSALGAGESFVLAIRRPPSTGQ